MQIRNGFVWIMVIGCLLASSALAAVSGEDAPASPTGTAGSAHASAEGSVRAEHASAGPQQGKRPSGAAAETSKLASTGNFIPAELQIAKRAPFGAKAGKTEDRSALAPPEPVSGLYFWLFTAGAGACLLASAGLAFSMSRTTRVDGTPGRALTVGSKLAGGFGLLVTGTMLLAAISSRADLTVSATSNNVKFVNDQALLISELESEMLSMRICMKNFLMTNSDPDLASYSNQAAALAHLIELAKMTLKNPERVALIEKIDTHFGEYERKFAETVHRIDQRNGIIDSQMGSTATRATALLDEIILTAGADGDQQLSSAAAIANQTFQEARLAFFKYLRKSEEQFKKEATAQAEELIKQISALEAQVQNPRRKNWLKEASAAMSFWIAQMEQAEKMQTERNMLVKDGLDKIGPQISQYTNSLQASLNKTKQELTAEAHATSRSAALLVASIAGVVALLAAGLSFVIIRGITRPLAKVVGTLKSVAAGDLTAPPMGMTARDEIGILGEASDTMATALRRMVQDVKGTSNEVAAAATEVAASAEELAQTVRSQEQAATQVASAVTELSSSITEVANKSSESAKVSQESMKQAAVGGSLVQQTVTQLGQINERFTEVGTVVTGLEEQGQKVGRIVQVIQDIADQTNLLALNAAIEAARAGEHGRGFAVVADEVRKLAERTTQATGEVSATIGGMQQGTVKAAEAMSVGRKTVDEGAKMGVQAGDAVALIVNSQKVAGEQASAIAAATHQQASATEEISRTIEQMTAANAQSSGAASQASQAANTLSRQAEQLKGYMERYKV